MADQVTNQKVRIIADTAQYKKEMAAASKASKQFKDEAKGALDEFANIFGVNMAGIREGVGKVQTGFTALSTGMKTSAASSGILSTALKALKVALVSTGIGAIVVALGSLAAYFTRTERGAEGLQRVMAGFRAVIDVLIDRFATFGEGVFKIFTGKFAEGWQILKQSVSGIGAEMATEAKAAVELERALQAVEDREIALITVQSERRNKIEELRLKAKDLELTETERRDALGEAIKIEKQIAADEIALQKERVRIGEAQFEMSEKTDDKLRDLQESRAQLSNIEAQSLATIRGMTREYNGLTKAIEASNLALSERERITLPDGSEFKQIELKPITQRIGFDVDTQTLAVKFSEATQAVQANMLELSDVVSQSLGNLAISFGELLGNMMSGTAQFKDFGSLILSSLGELAVQVGKAAIAFGITMDAIKKSIKDPFTAIAAGVALIAVGTALKSHVAKSMEGMGSGGGGTYSSNANVYDTRTADYTPGGYVRPQPIAITVTGKLSGRGSDLIAVIDEANYRSAYRK